MDEEKDTPDKGHHCKQGDFTCFRMIGDTELILDAPSIKQIMVKICPFCGSNV